MQPANFQYHRASSIDEAESLYKANVDASFLAGGHSLIPAMKLRLSEPDSLVDISGIDDLKGINNDGTTIRIGAMSTHTEVENSDIVKDACSALGEAAGMIGDPQVRNRGTIGGNIAHADPASDYPGILMALKATIVTSNRSINIDDFFRLFTIYDFKPIARREYFFYVFYLFFGRLKVRIIKYLAVPVK